MPDIHIERHGDRWAVKDAPDAAPIFESYTLEEAESEARRRAEGGRVHVHGEAAGDTGRGQVGEEAGRPQPHEAREGEMVDRGTQVAREPQGGL